MPGERQTGRSHEYEQAALSDIWDPDLLEATATPLIENGHFELADLVRSEADTPLIESKLWERLVQRYEESNLARSHLNHLIETDQLTVEALLDPRIAEEARAKIHKMGANPDIRYGGVGWFYVYLRLEAPVADALSSESVVDYPQNDQGVEQTPALVTNEQLQQFLDKKGIGLTAQEIRAVRFDDFEGYLSWLNQAKYSSEQ